MAGSVYKRGAVWWAEIRRRSAPKSAKRNYISLRTRDQETAREIARLMHFADAPEQVSPIHQVVGRFLAYKRRKISQRFYEELLIVLHAWLRDTAIQEIGEVTPGILQDWFDRKTEKVKVSTAVSYLTWVGNFLAWCVREEYLAENCACAVEVPRYSKPVRRVFVSAPEVRVLINECEDPELRFCLFCGFHAGLRFGEVVQARPQWFELAERLLHVTRASDWEPKDRQDRTIPLTDEFCAFLAVYGLRVPFMIAPKANSQWRYRYTFIRRFKSYVASKGYGWLTFHDCRRTFASIAVSRGISLYKVAKWLGDSFAMVERHYGHLEPHDPEINRIFGT